MNDMRQRFAVETAAIEPRDWLRILAQYRDPTTSRSMFELLVTFVPFVLLWAVAWWAATVSPWLALAISAMNSGFLLRLFTIQHDCGHGSFFRGRQVNDWIGRALGVLTLTPYDVWRRGHSIHHSGSGNLDKRGIGDIFTMTTKEFEEASLWDRLVYRLYRHPVTLFVIGPVYIFGIQNRVPVGFFRAGAKYWVSAMGTNVAIAVLCGILIYFMGLGTFLLVCVPTAILASAAGMWLFYVQHQFEETVWDDGGEWDMHEAALHGSSYYVMPRFLQWMTGNIGVHHVHHLYSRIPFYRLTEVLRDHPQLAEMRRMTIPESLKCARLNLWDETSRRLVSFREARRARD